MSAKSAAYKVGFYIGVITAQDALAEEERAPPKRRKSARQLFELLESTAQSTADEALVIAAGTFRAMRAVGVIAKSAVPHDFTAARLEELWDDAATTAAFAEYNSGWNAGLRSVLWEEGKS